MTSLVPGWARTDQVTGAEAGAPVDTGAESLEWAPTRSSDSSRGARALGPMWKFLGRVGLGVEREESKGRPRRRTSKAQEQQGEDLGAERRGPSSPRL